MSVMEMQRLSQILSLSDYLQASAERFPDRIAIVDPDGRQTRYHVLHEDSSRLAGFLRSRGVNTGDRVGLLLPKSSATLTAIFAILKARAAYVPVDYSAPGARITSIFEDCKVRAIFTNAAGFKVLKKEYAGSLPETIVIVGDEAVGDGAVAWKTALSHAPADDLAPAKPTDLAYILYTSGSTGIPKGVMLSQENATSFVDWCSGVFSPTEEDRFSSHAPFHFDLSILDIYLSIKHGASLHIVSEDLGKSPKELAQFIAERKLTVWYSTPSILALLAQFGNLQAFDCSSIRLVFFAGEVFPVRHLKSLTKLWPLPRYFNLYGPTETNVCTFAEVPSSIPEDRTEPYPIGPACQHCVPLVLNSEKVAAQPGEEGLLYISGPSVFQGYWNRPAENAAAFLERDGIRWYCTGDVVREDPKEGFIYVGRRDRMVKRRGYRIELDDIECALYRHPGIREAGVVACVAGDEHTKIVAYLAAGSDPKPGVIEMKMFCGQNLPNYMNPDSFVFMDSLPRTSTNKVDYQALLKKLR